MLWFHLNAEFGRTCTLANNGSPDPRQVQPEVGDALADDEVEAILSRVDRNVAGADVDHA